MRLPVHSEKALLAVIRAELTVSEDETDLSAII